MAVGCGIRVHAAATRVAHAHTRVATPRRIRRRTRLRARDAVSLAVALVAIRTSLAVAARVIVAPRFQSAGSARGAGRAFVALLRRATRRRTRAGRAAATVEAQARAAVHVRAAGCAARLTGCLAGPPGAQIGGALLVHRTRRARRLAGRGAVVSDAQIGLALKIAGARRPHGLTGGRTKAVQTQTGLTLSVDRAGGAVRLIGRRASVAQTQIGDALVVRAASAAGAAWSDGKRERGFDETIAAAAPAVVHQVAPAGQCDRARTGARHRELEIEADLLICIGCLAGGVSDFRERGIRLHTGAGLRKCAAARRHVEAAERASVVRLDHERDRELGAGQHRRRAGGTAALEAHRGILRTCRIVRWIPRRVGTRRRTVTLPAAVRSHAEDPGGESRGRARSERDDHPEQQSDREAQASLESKHRHHSPPGSEPAHTIQSRALSR